MSAQRWLDDINNPMTYAHRRPSDWTLRVLIVGSILAAFLAGYASGRMGEVVCEDGVEFAPIWELHPDAYAGTYAVCGITTVVVLD